MARLANVTNVVVGALGLAVVATTASAVELAKPVVLQPAAGQSFDIGAKHAVAYFLNKGGVCDVTLVMAQENAVVPVKGAGARFRVQVASGKMLSLETGDGKSVQLQCVDKATSMFVKPMAAPGGVTQG